MGHNICTRLRSVSGRVYSVIHILVVRTGCPTVVLVFFVEEVVDGHTHSYFYNRQIKKFPTEKQNVSLKHILT